MASAADLPVDLVEEIFLHLDDAADLVRASAACAAFRRVVSDGRFLRRFRSSLHRRPLLGLLSRRSSASVGFSFHPAEPPRRSAQAARTVAQAAGLSSSFLPDLDKTEHCWHVHDARDGRVLLSPDAAAIFLSSFSYLVVYDPLHRKHVQIPPIPKDIVACTCTEQQCECECKFDPFLVPANYGEDDLSFRVMCTVLSVDMDCDFMLETFVYSSVTGKWRGVASISDADYESLYHLHLSSMERHYASGCFYWVASYSFKDMLMFDMNEMKFSVVRLPPGTMHKCKVVVKAAAEDRIGMLVLCRSNKHKKLQFYTKVLGDAANDCWSWRRHDDAEITLHDSCWWFFGGPADEGYALLLGFPRDEFVAWRRSPEDMRPKISGHYFTVELQTMVVEQLCVVELEAEPFPYAYSSFPPAFLYASFPPPFALPSL